VPAHAAGPCAMNALSAGWANAPSGSSRRPSAASAARSSTPSPKRTPARGGAAEDPVGQMGQAEAAGAHGAPWCHVAPKCERAARGPPVCTLLPRVSSGSAAAVAPAIAAAVTTVVAVVAVVAATVAAMTHRVPRQVRDREVAVGVGPGREARVDHEQVLAGARDRRRAGEARIEDLALDAPARAVVPELDHVDQSVGAV